MFPLMDEKEHRPLKEIRMAKGDEGRTRVGHWIKGRGERSLCDASHLFRDYT